MHAADLPPELPGFMQTQFAFAAAVRDPDNAPPPSGVAAQRLAVYQELVFNNIEEFLANAFPVLRRISDKAYWHALVRAFIVEHRARTPLFPELPREFVDYLAQTRSPRKEDYPFLPELAHYEWTELAVGISELAIDENTIPKESSLLHGIPLISPLIRLCHYRFPVHRIGPAFLPTKADDTPTHLLVYRNRQDKVGFLELNPITARLVKQLETNHTHTAEVLLGRIAAEIRHPNPATVLQGGKRILEELRRRDVILGVKPEGIM